MARETKSQREQRIFAENAEITRRHKEQYHVRLMKALEKATALEFDIRVVCGRFVVKYRHSNSDAVILLTYEYTPDSFNSLLNLEVELDFKEAEMNEIKRIEALKQNALAKLSIEEREVLGL